MAPHSKNNYLAAQFRRVSARRGAKRGALAVDHRILVAICHTIAEGVAHVDAGGAYFDQRDVQRTVRRSVARLENLGFRVSIAAAWRIVFSEVTRITWLFATMPDSLRCIR